MKDAGIPGIVVGVVIDIFVIGVGDDGKLCVVHVVDNFGKNAERKRNKNLLQQKFGWAVKL